MVNKIDGEVFKILEKVSNKREHGYYCKVGGCKAFGMVPQDWIVFAIYSDKMEDGFYNYIVENLKRHYNYHPFEYSVILKGDVPKWLTN